MDVCRRQNLIKRVPLPASKKWRERSCCRPRGPLLGLGTYVVFVSIDARCPPQLHVCIRDVWVHVSCDWLLSLCCVWWLAQAKCLLSTLVLQVLADCEVLCIPGFSPGACCLCLSPKVPCVRCCCQPAQSGCAERAEHGQTMVVIFSGVSGQQHECCNQLRRRLRPYAGSRSGEANKQDSAVLAPALHTHQNGSTLTVRFLFATE